MMGGYNDNVYVQQSREKEICSCVGKIIRAWSGYPSRISFAKLRSDPYFAILKCMDCGWIYDLPRLWLLPDVAMFMIDKTI